MSQNVNTNQHWRYEVRSPEYCTVTDSSGIHLCTAGPGSTAFFYGDGKAVVLSCDAAVVQHVPDSGPRIWQMTAMPHDSALQKLSSQLVYRAGELLRFAPNITNGSADFICELSFTSGSIPTEIAAPAEWRWRGDDVADGAFVPTANKRYSVVLYSDGVLMRGLVRGESL